MITQEEGMQDGQSDWTSDQTNKQIEKLMFGQIFIISFFNSDYKLNLNFKILMN